MCTLLGQRIVITRAAHQAEELAAPLRKLGADIILLPVIGIAPPLDPEPLRQAAARLYEYDWIIFTSANSVSAFAAELPGPPEICKARVATVGAPTREAAEQRGFRVTVTPSKYVAEHLVEALNSEDLNNRRVLIPSAAVTRDVVPRELRKHGAHVNVVEAYRNILPPEAATSAAAIFQEPYPDWVLFASSSAVDNLVKLIGVERLRYPKVASIGPITSETVRKYGLTLTTEAKIQTTRGMVNAVCEATSMH